MDWGSGMPDENGKIGDIKWKNDYHEIRMSLNNHGDDDYNNVRISVDTDLNIAHVARFGKCLDGSVEPGIQFGPMEVGGPGGVARQTNPEGPVHIPVPGVPGQTMNSFGSYAPTWAIQCDKIRAKDSIPLSLAVVHLDKGFNLLPPQKPSWVRLSITYESMGHRRRKIERKIQIVESSRPSTQ
jgi:hypothetical protein